MQVLSRYRWPGNVRELQNVVEQATWLANGEIVDGAAAWRLCEPTPPVRPTRERRAQVADELYAGLVNSGYSFWDHIHPLFLSRDITRHDMRELGMERAFDNSRQLPGAAQTVRNVEPGLQALFNFLAAHDCGADLRAFRHGTAEAERPPRLPSALASQGSSE